MSYKTINFETACEVLGIEAKKLDVSGLPEQYQKETSDKYEIQVIADAINKENGDWNPDYTKGGQWKYRPWFNGSSGRWSSLGCDYWNAYSYVGSRLVFENDDDAEYFGKLIIELGYSI